MRINKVLLVIVGIVLLLPASMYASTITFSTFVNGTDIANTESGNNSTIGFAYAGNKFVGSVYFGNDNNQLYQVPLAGCPTVTAGCVTPFGSPIPGADSELYVSSSLGLGGFANHAIFTSNGTQGGLYEFSNDGSTQGVYTVTGATSLNTDYVKGIAFDPYGDFGNDMLVTTNSGNVYTVTSAGVATLLFSSSGQVVEGVDFASSAWGSYAGDAIIASESAGGIYIVAPNGSSTFVGGIPEAEEVGVVPLNLGVSGNPVEGFYAANYPVDIQKAAADQFSSLLGDAVVTSEDGSNARIWAVQYNGGTSFTVLGPEGNLPNQAEDGIFVTQALLDTAVPEPATLLLLGSGLLLVGRRLRRR